MQSGHLNASIQQHIEVYMKQVIPMLIGLIDQPGMFDSLETWEQHLIEMQAMPDWSLKPDMIREIKRVISVKGSKDNGHHTTANF